MSALAVASNAIVARHIGIPCTDAEPRLAQAFEDKALVVVNDLMVVKVFGDLIGIALEEVDLPGGRTELGWWYELEYAPEPGPIRMWKEEQIKDTFKAGEVRINFPGTTNWMPLRPVNERRVCPGEDLTEKAIRIARSLEKGGPLINGISREEYLIRNTYWATHL